MLELQLSRISVMGELVDSLILHTVFSFSSQTQLIQKMYQNVECCRVGFRRIPNLQDAMKQVGETLSLVSLLR